MTRTGLASVGALLGVWTIAPAAHAQLGAFEGSYGRWKPDPVSIIWTAGVRRTLTGPLSYTLSLSHLDDRGSLADRTQTGAEISFGWGRDGSGLYAVAGVGAGMKHDDGNLDATWSAGVGWAVRILPFLSIGVETRYRVEDQFSRGFWTLDPTDRRGPSLTMTAAIISGRTRAPQRPPAPGFRPPTRREVERNARSNGVSRPGSELASEVVQTALEVMGTPYRWGGEGANGYDCSGLIQFAYGQHGIILPRVSREQARLGIAVETSVASLNAGDILGFSVEGAAVSHVGLYIGQGQFIHSASGGVKLSSLTATDPDSQWWQRRWVQTRRILQ